MSPQEAAHRTMDEVGGALISIALTLCAVFVPSAFLSAISGLFFGQFAVAIAASTVISCFVSLTLSPALCAALFEPHDAHIVSRAGLARRLLHKGFDRFNRRFEVGLTPTDVFSTLQVYLGSQYVNDFNYLGRTYKVVTQADGEFRRTSLDIARLKARNTSGEMVPIGTVAQLKDDTIRFLSIGRAVRELEVAARDRPDRSDVLARLCHWFARARPTHRYSESDRFCRPRRTGCLERDPDR